MNPTFVIVLVASLVWMSRGSLAAQAALPLSLAEATSRAMETSHRLAEIRARARGSQATVRLRQIADLPTVTVTGGYARTNHVEEFGVTQPGGAVRVIYPDLPDNLRTRVEFNWPIFTGGRTDYLERAAQTEVAALGADLEAARADLRLEVERVYWALVTGTESVRVLDEALARADVHLQDVRSRYEVGLLPPNDVLNVEAQRSRQDVLLIEARNVRDSMATELGRLTGLDALQPVTLTERLEIGLAPSRAEQEALVAEALRVRPERRALTSRISGAQERQRAVAASAVPVIAVVGGLDYANPNPRIFPRRDQWEESWDVSVNVSWSLWDAGRTAAEIDEAAAAVEATRARLAEFERVVSSEVRQRLLDLDSSRAAVLSAADAVRSATEAQRVARERFGVGVATSTEVLDAQLALLQAELDRTRALANVRLAEARLDRALGR